MRLALVLMPALLIAGCASPESRLRTGLADAGLSKRQSGCMAGRMVDKLSLGQLIKLSSLSKVNREDVRDTGITRFLHNVRALQDPEIVAVTTKAALGCAITG